MPGAGTTIAGWLLAGCRASCPSGVEAWPGSWESGRQSDGLAAVFMSDLRRAAGTAALAFADSDLPVLADWRLRECDYGELNGARAARVHAMRYERLAVPYPGGRAGLKPSPGSVGSWVTCRPDGRTSESS